MIFYYTVSSNSSVVIIFYLAFISFVFPFGAAGNQSKQITHNDLSRVFYQFEYSISSPDRSTRDQHANDIVCVFDSLCHRRIPLRVLCLGHVVTVQLTLFASVEDNIVR